MKSIEEVLGVSNTNARMLICHNFVSQDVFVTEERDIAAMCTAQDKLLIATSRMTIEVHDLVSKGQVLMTFPTIDKVTMVDYCGGGNFVVTLEREMLSNSSDVSHVRVYLNWWNEVCNQEPVVRKAGCQPTPDTVGNRLEVVELPVGCTSASCIACCRQSGTIAVAVNDMTKLFCLKNCYDDFRKYDYLDFEFLMNVRVTFVPTRVYVCEDYMACCSEKEVHVFRICLEVEQPHLDKPVVVPDTPKKKKQLSNGLLESGSVLDDPYFVEWRFDSEENPEWENAQWEEKLKSVLHPSTFPVTLSLQSAQISSERHKPDDIVLGPRVNAPEFCNVSITVNPNTDLTSGFDGVSATTLLYRRFNSHAESGKRVEAFHWVPYYFQNEDNTVSDPLSAAVSLKSKPLTNVLRSQLFAKLNTLTCFVSCTDQGYFYDLNNAKATMLLSIYKYSNDIKGVALDECFLHALTSTGLETYTLPIPYEPLVHSCEEKEVPGKPAIMIGLRPFLGLGTLIMSDHHLILASSSEDCSSSSDSIELMSSTLYSLLKPTMSQLFYDLKEAASIYKNEERLAYMLALKEGFLILKTQILLQGRSRCNSELMAAYSDSCCILGDLCLKSDSELEREQAAHYYGISEETPETIVKRIMLFKGQIKTSSLTRGVIHYVKLAMHNKSPELKKGMECLSQATADAILDIFAEECPDALYRLILCSGITSFRSEKAIGLLKKKLASKRQSQGYVADSLAIVHLLLQIGNNETAQNILKTLSKEFFVPILLELHELVHSGQALTQLGRLVKTTRPDAYFSMLVHLKNNGSMTPEQVVLILRHSSPLTDVHRVPLLKEFLEAILSSKRMNSQAYPHLLIMLVKVYLGRMAPQENSPQQTAPSVHTKPASLFGSRPVWLLELPPFSGRHVTKTCSLYTTSLNLSECCLCWNCWDDLLRLQSFLCSELPSGSVRAQILEIYEKTPLSGSENYISLKVLCLPPTRAVALLLDQYPTAVLGYMEDKFPEECNEWVSLYKAVDEKLEQEWCGDEKTASAYKTLLAGVLTYLSGALNPEELVNLLPPGKQGYMEYVRQCMEWYQAKLLKEKIIALGTELKEMM
ncbi:unnamed protein product [Ixodes hexagonus]